MCYLSKYAPSYRIVQVSFIILIFFIAVCSAPPSSLNGSVQADDGQTYVEGDEVNFQCLSSLMPVDVMTTTCTEEGNWSTDPQLLQCFIPGMLSPMELIMYASSS